jgi:signal transduction histidine kinase/ligand-binding sensor domain-containing protein
VRLPRTLKQKIGTFWPLDLRRRSCGHLWVCCVALVICQHAFGIDRDVRLDQLSHTAWTAKDGVPTDVRAIAQTSDGALWIGTENALYRFDGVRFILFHSATGPILRGESVQCLLADPDGSLWVGFNSASISHIKDGAVINYEKEDGVPFSTITAIVKDRSGVIWAATTSGMIRLDRSHWTIPGPEWAAPTVTCLTAYLDRNGGLWVGTMDQLFYLAEGKHKFQVAADHLHFVADIKESRDGTLWIAEALRSVHPAELSWSTSGRKLSEIRAFSGSILFDRGGSLWIATGGYGIRRVAEPDRLNGRKIRDSNPAEQTFTKKDGLSNDYVRKLFEDREGNVWTASLGGIDRFRQTPLVPISLPSGIADMSLALGTEDKLLIGSTNRPLGEFANPRFTSLTGPGFSLSKKEQCSGAANGLDGEVWFNCTGGLVRIHGSHKELFHRPSALNKNAITTAMAEDSAGAVWIAYPGAGIYRFDKGKWSQFEAWKGVGHEVHVAFADSAGRVWFGYSDSTIAVEQDGKMARVYDKDTVGRIEAFVIQGQGADVWVGGLYGLVLWDGNRFRKVSFLGKSRPPLITGLIATQRDGLWIEAETELIHIGQIEIDRWKSDYSHPVAFRTFGSLDGLSWHFFRGLGYPDAIQGSDGRLWFSTEPSAYWLDSKRISPDPPPPASILSIAAGGHELPVSASLRLPAHTTNLKIEYTSWSLGTPERLRFRYRLHGIDSEWQDAENIRTATYTNLGPGDYWFEVTTSNGDGIWGSNAQKITISIAPAFYQAAWFKVLEILAALALIWLFILMRTRQAAEKIENRMAERLLERDRIARELHDTLLQGFQGLVLKFQTALNAIPPGERSRAMMEETLSRADLILIEGRERIRGLRSHEGDTGELTDVIAKVGGELGYDHPATFRMVVQGQSRSLHPVVRDELEAIAKEALANAFRHAHASEIACEIVFGENHFLLVCSDDGIGIPREILLKESSEGHWGLVGMRERAEKIGATMKLSRGDDGGTRLEVRLNSRVAYSTPSKRGWSPFRRPIC